MGFIQTVWMFQKNLSFTQIFREITFWQILKTAVLTSLQPMNSYFANFSPGKLQNFLSISRTIWRDRNCFKFPHCGLLIDLYSRITALYAPINYGVETKANSGFPIDCLNRAQTQFWGRINRKSARNYEDQLAMAKLSKLWILWDYLRPFIYSKIINCYTFKLCRTFPILRKLYFQ